MLEVLTLQQLAAIASIIVSSLILLRPVRKYLARIWRKTFGRTVHLLEQHIADEEATLKRIEGELTTNGCSSIKDILIDLRDRQSSFDAYLNAQMNVQKLALFRTDKDGKVIANNRYHQRLIGFSFEELKGDGWVNVIHPDDRTRVHKLWSEAVAENREFSENIKYIKPGGDPYMVHVEAYRELDRSGTIRGYLGVVTVIESAEKPCPYDEVGFCK